MSVVFQVVPRVALFLAGVAAGALTGARREKSEPAASAEIAGLKDAIAALEAKVEARNSFVDERFHQVETRLDEQAAKLAEVPSTAQIVAAMEQILARSMASLDERLSAQAHSIEVLRTTVSQTDGLLERVLESLDSFQAYTDPSELATDTVLHRPTV